MPPAPAEQVVMTKQQAWKAFRMGVIAAFAPDKPSVAAWGKMKKRFDDWYASYANGFARRREGAFTPRAKRTP